MRIRVDVIELDGVVVARSDEVDKPQRIDALYDGLKRRRQREEFAVNSEPSRRLLVAFDPQVRAIVVKSVVQTGALAGYHDVAFVVDGGVIPVGW